MTSTMTEHGPQRAEGSASDEAQEGAGEAQRSPVLTIARAEGSASDEAQEGAGEAQRSPVLTIEGRR